MRILNKYRLTISVIFLKLKENGGVFIHLMTYLKKGPIIKEAPISTKSISIVLKPDYSSCKTQA